MIFYSSWQRSYFQFRDFPSAIHSIACAIGHLASTPAYWAACQGAFAVIHQTETLLAEVAGMAAASIQPMAGAQGELAGALMMAAYHRDRGNAKDTILIYPLSRNSRATGPKMRVPRGLLVTGSRITPCAVRLTVSTSAT